MKKFITIILVGLMVLSSISAVFAEGPSTAKSSLAKEKNSVNLSIKKEFTEEIHKMNALKVESKQLQIQVIENKDKLVDLYIEARESGNKETLTAAKEERKQIKEINIQIKALYEQALVTRKAFKDALQNKDKEAAITEIQKLIDIHSSINVKIDEKIQVLSTMIDILS